jgi:hypothetical protein
MASRWQKRRRGEMAKVKIVGRAQKDMFPRRLGPATRVGSWILEFGRWAIGGIELVVMSW